METFVREISAELAARPILIGLFWMGCLPRRLLPLPCVLRRLHSRLWCGATTEAAGRLSAGHSVYQCHPRFRYELDYSRMDLEAGTIDWAIQYLRGCLWGTKFRICSCRKAL